MTDHQNTRHLNITTTDNRLNPQHLPFTHGSAGSSQNLKTALNSANTLDSSRNFDVPEALDLLAQS